MDQNKDIKNTAEIFHSNGIAQFSIGGQISSASKTSFTERKTSTSVRNLVGPYNASFLGRSVNNSRPAIVKLNKNRQLNNAVGQRPSGVRVEPRRFSEPSARNYNPYS